ncbi:hypothetical protein HOF92_00595 [bacterium]|nr:hypothetical protein [bacterium]
MTVLFIFGVSFFYMTGQQVSFIRKMDARLKARYLAEGAMEKALFKIQKEFQRELIYHEKTSDGEEQYEINDRLLNLIDIRRIEDFSRVLRLNEDEIIEGGDGAVLTEVLDVKANEFYTFIDYQEKIPENLRVFQKPRNAKSTVDLEPLGGFRARIKFTSCGKFQKTIDCMDTVKYLNVSDITPPAPDHTLFIHSKNDEMLKRGAFRLSNLTLPPVIVKLLYRLSQQVKDILGFEIGEDRKRTLDLIEELNKNFTETFRSESLDTSLSLIQELSRIVTDDDISETVDNIILSLSPRNWGRVRTNGKLEVYMPFFAADDIINYFAEKGSWRELPEVGYLFHDNRLHDPYMSVYTHYEGLIYKRYRKIYPSRYGAIEPEEVPPEQYTINTRLEYPRRYKHRLHIENLERLRNHGVEVANATFEVKLKLEGTNEVPLALEGIWYFRDGLEIKGTYTGRGIIISEQPIVINGDLVKKHERDSLSLVSLWNEIILKSPQMKIHSALYAHMGLRSRGCDDLFVLGNLAVERLKRDSMPEKFHCRFDYHLKNHMVDNLFGHFAAEPLYFRELTGRSNQEILDSLSAIPPL